MDEKMVSLRINDIPVTVPEGSTVLEAARSAGFNIPSLCFLKDINEIGACRICVVEVKGAKSLVASCVYPVAEGMEVYTNTRAGTQVPPAHPGADPLQPPDGLPHLLPQQPLRAAPAGQRPGHRRRCGTPATTCRPRLRTPPPTWCGTTPSASSAAACTAVCRKTQEVGVIGPNDRGFDTHIGCAFDRDLAEVDCVSCGQCIVACPTGALAEKDDTAEVLAALDDPDQARGGAAPPPPSGSPWASASACPSAPTWRARWSPPCAAWASTRCSTWTPPPTSPFMEEGTEFLSRLQRRRHPAPHHLLLPRLGPVSGAARPRHDPQHLLLQVPPADVRLPGQDLLRRAGRASTPRTSSWCPSCPAPPRSTRYCGRSSGCPTAACRWTCPSPPGSWAA